GVRREVVREPLRRRDAGALRGPDAGATLAPRRALDGPAAPPAAPRPERRGPRRRPRRRARVLPRRVRRALARGGAAADRRVSRRGDAGGPRAGDGGGRTCAPRSRSAGGPRAGPPRPRRRATPCRWGRRPPPQGGVLRAHRTPDRPHRGREETEASGIRRPEHGALVHGAPGIRRARPHGAALVPNWEPPERVVSRPPRGPVPSLRRDPPCGLRDDRRHRAGVPVAARARGGDRPVGAHGGPREPPVVPPGDRSGPRPHRDAPPGGPVPHDGPGPPGPRARRPRL